MANETARNRVDQIRHIETLGKGIKALEAMVNHPSYGDPQLRHGLLAALMNAYRVHTAAKLAMGYRPVEVKHAA